ncbi:MAG: aminoacyl-tRNA hydrolase [Candidatus Daviesbacteria bacterium]|nr:aminoacyl-tRNA hydrolase [Candidatus Daviesbacteria bacterium]
MKVIVGLGNPGEKYVGVRHNLGFMVVEELGKKMDDGRWKMGVEDRGWKLDKKCKSEILKTTDLLLVKPQTYMNNSGLAVKLLTAYYKLPATDVIVIHDELDLPLGKIKVRIGGAAAGHHGVESIIASLGTDQFIRVRVGIGPAVGVVEKFVLESFASKEKPQVKHVIKQALKALDLLLEKGLEKAQNQYN